jgi:hypothetical protein
MVYFIHIDNKVQGPFTEEEIRTQVKLGTLCSTDLACVEGEEQWKPINEFSGYALYSPCH